MSGRTISSRAAPCTAGELAIKRGWLELDESGTFQRRGPLRLSVGASVSPLSCPQSFTNLRQA